MTVEPPQWTIEFCADAPGTSAVLEFINGLQNREQAKVFRFLQLLREFGTKLGPPHAKPLVQHKPLWELRPGAIRLLYFAHTDRRFIILHAFRKKSQRTPKRHIDTAERRMTRFLEGEK